MRLFRIVPSVLIHTGINSCSSVVTTITITVVVTTAMIAINTVVTIITGTRAVITTITNDFLINISMSTHPITTTAIITTICVNSSGRSSNYYYNYYCCCSWYQYQNFLLQIIVFRASTRANAANTTIATFIALPVLDVML